MGSKARWETLVTKNSLLTSLAYGLSFLELKNVFSRKRKISLIQLNTKLVWEIFSSTRSRDRTGTTSQSLVFETSASTNSAIRAVFALINFGVQK